MSGDGFDPRSVRCFRFLGYGFDVARATAWLDYGFDDTHRFREELTFPRAAPPAGAAGAAALERCLRYLHLAAGVSYYKAAAPPEIVVETGPLSPAEGRFYTRLYRRGLAEFAYRNRLPRVCDELAFAASSEAVRPPPPELRLDPVTAVPIGGGKDSIVALAALHEAGERVAPIAVGDFAPIRATVAAAGLELRVVERRISPLLLELNRAGAYNGHVPISAIFAFTLATAGVLWGFDSAALANERSADAPDLVWEGRPVNHEYSKGLEFESAADELIGAGALPGFRYFSLLRPFSELSIAGLFRRRERYHRVFRSCNAAYRLRPGDRAPAWCRECPKCRFVFVALAPFFAPPELATIFGGDLLADEGQLGGYRRLAGLAGHRPLECVGEEAETQAALLLAAVSPGWRDAAVVRRLAPEVRRRVAEPRELVSRVLTPSPAGRIPPRHRPAADRLARWAVEDRDRLLTRLDRPVAAG